MIVPRNTSGHCVVHYEASENRHTDFKGDGERDIVEYSEPRCHDGSLAFGEIGCFGCLLFIEATTRLRVRHCYESVEDTHIAASMNNLMSS